MASTPWLDELRDKVRRKLSGKRILLAADEDDIVASITAALVACGCEVVVEPTSTATREAASSESISLLLLRLKLRDLAGRPLIGFMRIRATADTPIIVLQRRGDPRVSKAALAEAHIDRTLTVPCHESELLALLDAFWPEPRGR